MTSRRHPALAHRRRPRPRSSPPEAAPESRTDAAAPLDLLLTDGARGVLRRFAPTGPGLRWAVDLAHRPRRSSTACGTCPASWGRSRSAGRGRARRTGSPLPRRRLAHQPAAAADPAGLPGRRRHGPRVARRRPPRLARPRPPGVRPRQPRRRPRPEQQPAHQPDRLESADRLRRRERSQGPAQPGRRPGHRPPRADDGPARRVRGRRRPRRHPGRGGAADRDVRADPVHPADADGADPRRCSSSHR